MHTIGVTFSFTALPESQGHHKRYRKNIRDWCFYQIIVFVVIESLLFASSLSLDCDFFHGLRTLEKKLDDTAAGSKPRLCCV